jgi:hypothetical protein
MSGNSNDNERMVCVILSNGIVCPVTTDELRDCDVRSEWADVYRVRRLMTRNALVLSRIHVCVYVRMCVK